MTKIIGPELEPEAAAEGWLPEAPAMQAHQVMQAVKRRHPMDGFNGEPGRWVTVGEIPVTTGAYGDVQRLDVVAIGLVPSVRYARVVYEIKVSRSDWLHELKPIPDVRWFYNGTEHRESARAARIIAKALSAETSTSDRLRSYHLVGEYHKWDAAVALSTEFWIAAPPRVVQLDELPVEAGLLEVRPWGKEGEMRGRVVRAAPVRDTPLPDQGFWAAVLRRAAGRKPPGIP